MATYLLTWNPDKSDWTDFDEAVAATQAGHLWRDSRSCGGTKRIARGDRLFLHRQGPDDPGLIGHGYALGKPEYHRHWDPEKRAKRQDALFVDVDFDFLSKRSVIARRELLQPPLNSVRWDTQSSGITINEEVAARLD